jgi:hypothetical protein
MNKRLADRPLSACSVVLAISIAACQSNTETGVRLTVNFGPALAIDQLKLTIATDPADAAGPITRLTPETPGSALPDSTRVLVLIADAWGGRTVEFEVAGLGSGAIRATGKASVAAKRGEFVELSVELTEVKCADTCPADDRQCIGDSLRVCLTGADGCTAWTPPQTCPAEKPFCSLGQCATKCQDECSSAGGKRCHSGGYQICGKYGSGGCLSWGQILGCADKELCKDGECVPDCGGKPCSCKAGETSVCADKGECKGGQRTCGPDGTLGGCVWQIGPKNEVCDGKDNDCSG